ncbi:phosphatidylinositol-specific phospholipase C1-like protein [Brevundimonas sp. R86498]|uniref:phosphatidylinositol-specific phospholipase C1-like protein n=1 Tax=Brevundimonas sp. R86498 TaxID=3093845 RepID=UPI0037C95827
MLNLVTSLLLAALQPACLPDAPDLRSAGGDACARVWMDRHLRMTDVTTVGTHNSYKLAIPIAELDAMLAANPNAIALDYAHRPLTQQLEAGARQIEIDVLHDPEGGRYSTPPTALGRGVVMGPGFAEAMARPGFKTLHMQDVDFRSSCLTFVACLREIRDWSRSHPDHVPILIMLNAKTGPSVLPGGTMALPFDERAWDALDAEIRSVFDNGALITPDEVQGDHPTLRDAVLTDGWPRLGAARGRVFFALDEGPEKVASYRGSRHALEGRAMFVNTDESSPAAAYLTLNDPMADRDRIAAAVRAGFMVRTRADADTREARAGAVTRRDTALAGGAQYVSTDYLWPDPRFLNYDVRLADGAAAVCNPVRAAGRCDRVVVETLTP